MRTFSLPYYFYSCHMCLLLVFALFHFCLSNPNSDHALCIDSERQALLVFKHDLFDKTNRLASWVADDIDCCRWAGIVCDNSTGHVHEIHLQGADGRCITNKVSEGSNERLKGNISSSLLDLKQLKHLDLSCNDFRGIQIPKFIGSFKNLRYLNLSYSNFSGIVPPQLGNLLDLQTLGLGSTHDRFKYTSMTNMHWLSSLGKLHHLDVSGMYLNKASDWLQVINTLPSLVQLHMSDCVLSNPSLYVPNLNLTSLLLLDLSFNSFDSSAVQWIFGLSSLVSLDLSGCYFHDVSRSIHSFRNMTSLKFLNLAQSNFLRSSLALKELSSTSLISLDISDCGVSSSFLDSLHNLTSLRSLDISSNQLTKRVPKSLGNLCSLREVDSSFNNFDNITLSYHLESFLECKSPALESLSLSLNDIHGIIPDSIAQLSFLRMLNLGINQISGPIPYLIGRLSSLEELYLQHNQLNGSLPDSIAYLSSLKKLDLSQNQLDGNLPQSLGQLSKLMYLDLSYNLLTGVVTEAHFAKLVSLNYLDGTSNNLTLSLQTTNWVSPFRLEYMSLKSWVLGPQFPLWLQSQKNLTVLDISNTYISSPMPESFMRSFPNLIYLNISHNHIEGILTSLSIPATLQVVDLSSNEFCGSVHHLLCSNGVKRVHQLILGK